MFRSFFVFIAILILISACAPAPQATPQPDQPTTTSSPPLTRTPTRTALPSATLTAFITPLPTIPTFTPTFDVSTIVTVTPAPKAECPKEDPNLVPNFELPDSLSCAQRGGTQEECFPKGVEKKFLDDLNSGGSVKSLLNLYYPNGYLNQNPRTHFPQDVTGDETLELLFYDLRLYRSPNIYYCNSGKYELFTFHNEGHSIRLHTPEDLNRNNIPEIVFTISGCSGSGCFGVSIF